MKKKNKTRDSQALLADLAHRVSAKSAGAQTIIDPQGEASLSDAISQLIDPFMDDAPDLRSFQKLVLFGCVAWNASNLPAEKQADLIEKVLASASDRDEDRLGAFGFITTLMERKERLFPEITRLIVDFKVTDQGDGFHIAVASTTE